MALISGSFFKINIYIYLQNPKDRQNETKRNKPNFRLVNVHQSTS